MQLTIFRPRHQKRPAHTADVPDHFAYEALPGTVQTDPRCPAQL